MKRNNSRRRSKQELEDTARKSYYESKKTKSRINPIFTGKPYSYDESEILKIEEQDPCSICPNNQIDTCIYIEENDRKSCSIVKDYLSKEDAYAEP